MPNVGQSVHELQLATRACTHLGTVGEEGGLFAVEFNGFRVQGDGGRKVTSRERLIPLVFEVDGFLRHGDAEARCSSPSIR